MATVTCFNFETKERESFEFSQAVEVFQAGKCCWIDIDLNENNSLETLLASLLISPMVLEEIQSGPIAGRHDEYPGCLHITLSEPYFVEGRLKCHSVDVILGERFIITIHRGESYFVTQTQRTSPQSFIKYARSLGFLLFEFADHSIDAYRRGMRKLQVEVEQLQKIILGEVDDSVFHRVARVTEDLLILWSHILADRDVLEALSIRRSPFVSETTQPFLHNLSGTLERLASDLTVERQTLTETLNLYMGFVSFRTNLLITRLTILSTVFLPLAFLCGLYGVNFKYVPELEYQYAYYIFLCVLCVIAMGLILFMRIKKVL